VEQRREEHDGTDVDDTPFQMAEVVDLVRLLMQHGSDLNAVDSRGRTPLQMAVAASLYEIVELLASHTPGQISTALHIATIRKDVRIVKLLVAHGAEIDARGHSGAGDGWTPLCLAARSGAADVTKALISAGANVHATSANGKTALEIATINRDKKACQSVLEVLHIEMVASVLEIAFQFRPPATTPGSRTHFSAARGSSAFLW